MSERAVGRVDVEQWAPELVVLIGAARSGTTLLRLILDAHPEIGCPAEAGIPRLVADLGRVWWTVDADILGARSSDPLEAGETSPDPAEAIGKDDADRPQNDQWPELPAEAKAAIREAAAAPMRHYCRRDKKRIYCDKSLDSVYHVGAVSQIFPKARYLLLVRHVMDAVASGIEASPWGFQAYGYAPFVQRSPENFVAALVQYWVSHVDAALRWEKAHPALCHRVRYEDLVTDPARVVAGILAFLGVEQVLCVLEQAFVRARSAKGPGDYKVTFTSEVDRNSIGRGKRVPVDMVPPALLGVVSEKLQALGYESLDRSWNAVPAQTNGASRELGASGTRLAELLPNRRLADVTGDRTIDSFALVAQDHQQLRWVVDLAAGTIRQGDGEVECVLTGTADDLAQLLAGETSPGVLLRSGRIRHLTAERDPHPADATDAVRLAVDAVGHGPLRCQDGRRVHTDG